MVYHIIIDARRAKGGDAMERVSVELAIGGWVIRLSVWKRRRPKPTDRPKVPLAKAGGTAPPPIVPSLTI